MSYDNNSRIENLERKLSTLASRLTEIENKLYIKEKEEDMVRVSGVPYKVRKEDVYGGGS